MKLGMKFSKQAWAQPGFLQILVYFVKGWVECSWRLTAPQAGGSGDPPALQCPEKLPLASLAPHLNHPSSLSASAPGKEVDTDLKYRGVMPVISLWDCGTWEWYNPVLMKSPNQAVAVNLPLCSKKPSPHSLGAALSQQCLREASLRLQFCLHSNVFRWHKPGYFASGIP